MKYFTSEYNNMALYYDTDLDRAFYLSKSYAKKHSNKIEGILIKNHAVKFDANNQMRQKTIMKAKLAGILDSNMLVGYKLNEDIRIDLIANFESDYCVITIDYHTYPLALEDFIKFVNEDCFMSSLDYVYDLYCRGMNINRDLFIRSKLTYSSSNSNVSDEFLIPSIYGRSLRASYFSSQGSMADFFGRIMLREYPPEYSHDKFLRLFSPSLQSYWYDRYVEVNFRRYDNINDWINSMPKYIGYSISKEYLLEVPKIELRIDRFQL